MATAKQGYLYIATGERYIAEAEVSARSLRAVDPDADVTLVSDRQIDSHLFDRIVVRPFEARSWKAGLLYKVRQMYEASPYEKTLFVDTDTYFCAACGELFELLDFYDLCIAHAPNDTSNVSLRERSLEGYYPYSTGVIAFRRSDINCRLFASWLSICETKTDSYQHDQGPLMEALLQSASRVYVLHPIYNAKLTFHVSFPGKAVKIIHGRHRDYERVRSVLNSTPVNRSWDPVSQSCAPVGAVRYVKAYAKYLRNQFSRAHD